jgi:hypothetical protein
MGDMGLGIDIDGPVEWTVVGTCPPAKGEIGRSLVLSPGSPFPWRIEISFGLGGVGAGRAMNVVGEVTGGAVVVVVFGGGGGGIGGAVLATCSFEECVGL